MSAPDLLNELHTLRIMARDVKRLAETEHHWGIALRCAAAAEEMSAAIDQFNGQPSPDAAHH